MKYKIGQEVYVVGWNNKEFGVHKRKIKEISSEGFYFFDGIKGSYIEKDIFLDKIKAEKFRKSKSKTFFRIVPHGEIE